MECEEDVSAEESEMIQNKGFKNARNGRQQQARVKNRERVRRFDGDILASILTVIGKIGAKKGETHLKRIVLIWTTVFRFSPIRSFKALRLSSSCHPGTALVGI
jgi:hypothetical protein